MTYLKTNWKTVIVAMLIATIFAIADQYIMNASSCLCGALLAGIWIDKHRKPVVKPKTKGGELVSEGNKCPFCGGKLRNIAAKKPGGVDQWRCASCHRKMVKGGGKLKQVAI